MHHLWRSRSTMLGMLLVLVTVHSVVAKMPDGKIASKLEEYHSTIKCMANIAEHMLPELNTYMACCGFWALQDMVIHQVETSCSEHNLEQVKHLNGLVAPHIRENCHGYEQGSFTCRMLVIMPITLSIFVILLITSVCVCSCVSFYKWIRVRRKYRRVINMNMAEKLGDQRSYDLKVADGDKPRMIKASKAGNQI